MASIWSIQEFACGRHLNLGAGVPFGIAFGQSGYCLKGCKSARSGVQVITGYAATLFVGKIQYVLNRMEAIMAGTQLLFRLNPRRRGGGNMAGGFIESELVNSAGSVPRDVRYECKIVGLVGLHSVGTRGRFQPFNWWISNCSVIAYGMDRSMGTLIIGG